MIDLRLYNLEGYRLERKKDLLVYTRIMDPKVTPTLELLFYNQIDRFEIIRDE